MSQPDVIKMPQRFDYKASAEFNSALTTALSHVKYEGAKIVLDCTHMDFIDSAGIGILVMAHKKAQAQRATIALINLKQSAKDILQLANLQKIVSIQ